jgi:hypothetical protein
MHPDEQNACGCPLRNQTGIVAIHDFDAILAALPPELRAAFTQERAARQAEIDSIIATNGYHT